MLVSHRSVLIHGHSQFTAAKIVPLGERHCDAPNRRQTHACQVSVSRSGRCIGLGWIVAVVIEEIVVVAVIGCVRRWVGAADHLARGVVLTLRGEEGSSANPLLNLRGVSSDRGSRSEVHVVMI